VTAAPQGQPAAPTASWAPANETEQAMAEAVLSGQRRDYFQMLATAELYLPAFAERDERGPQRFLTMELLDQEYLPVFTSPEALAAALGPRAEAYTVTNYPELHRKWPSPQWRLAVNPGTPIDAYVTIDAIPGAAMGDLVVPTAAEIVAEAQQAGIGAGQPDSDTSAALRTAMARQDVDGYVHALLDTEVIVPVTHPVPAADILRPEFPWRPVNRPTIDAAPQEPAESPTIEVFTSAATFQTVYPAGVPSVTVTFPAVVVGWPDDAYQLAVDPGTPYALTVSSEYVAGLVLWLSDEDLTDDGDLTGDGRLTGDARLTGDEEPSGIEGPAARLTGGDGR
jgi:hypothetical protein